MVYPVAHPKQLPLAFEAWRLGRRCIMDPVSYLVDGSYQYLTFSIVTKDHKVIYG
jgi:hypothetical protein